MILLDHGDYVADDDGDPDGDAGDLEDGHGRDDHGLDGDVDALDDGDDDDLDDDVDDDDYMGCDARDYVVVRITILGCYTRRLPCTSIWFWFCPVYAFSASIGERASDVSLSPSVRRFSLQPEA